jgi:anti-sigma-K factor RskA
VNVKEYISTGVLEAYVLGALNEAEQAAVERDLARHPELRQELAGIEAAQEALLMKASIAPPERVKAKLFEQIDAATPASRTISIKPAGRDVFWRLAAAAAVALAVITSYLAYDYRSKWKNASFDLNNLIAQNQRMAQDHSQVNQRLDRMENDMKVMRNPSFRRVVMKGMEKAPGSMASVYWNESSNEVYLNLHSMKKLPKGNQYQLWAIIDGKPVDAGVFDDTMVGLQKMKPIATGATMFAVTVEPRGGKASPTLETMQVAGEVVKS